MNIVYFEQLVRIGAIAIVLWVPSALLVATMRAAFDIIFTPK